MNNISMIIEAVGYIGSILVVVSMLMSSVIRIRIVNTIGSGIFAVYALIIKSYPTALMNLCLVAINIYNLRKLMKKEQSFEIADGNINDSMLSYMINYYYKDIMKYFPKFKNDIMNQDLVYIVYCKGCPVGVMIGKNIGDNTAKISLDYSIPTYRDCSVGKYLFSKLTEKGINKVVFMEEDSEVHKDYLCNMGFIKEKDKYVKIL